MILGNLHDSILRIGYIPHSYSIHWVQTIISSWTCHKPGVPVFRHAHFHFVKITYPPHSTHLNYITIESKNKTMEPPSIFHSSWPNPWVSHQYTHGCIASTGRKRPALEAADDLRDPSRFAAPAAPESRRQSGGLHGGGMCIQQSAGADRGGDSRAWRSPFLGCSWSTSWDFVWLFWVMDVSEFSRML